MLFLLSLGGGGLLLSGGLLLLLLLGLLLGLLLLGGLLLLRVVLGVQVALVLLLLVLLGLGGSHNGLSARSELGGAQHDLSDNSLEVSLVDASVEPSHHVGEGSAELSIGHKLEGVDKSGGDSDISKSDLVAHKVGLVSQMVVKHLKSAGHVSLGLGSHGGVVGHVSEHGVDPHGHGKLQVVGAEVHPGVHLARLEERAAIKLRISLVTSDVTSDGIGLGESSLGSGEHGHLAGGGQRQELGGLGVAAHLEVGGEGDVHVVVLGGDQDLEGTEVALVGVEGKARHGD